MSDQPEPIKWDKDWIFSIQDDILISIENKRPLRTVDLQQMPPMRAVMLARIARQAGVGLEHGTLEQLKAEADRVNGEGRLGRWWNEVRIKDGRPSELILITARDWVDVVHWCRAHEINPRSHNVRWVTDEVHLYGVRNAYYVDLGTYDVRIKAQMGRFKETHPIRLLSESDLVKEK